ncbi:MAG: hypothetical protein DRI39_10750, partial [Chloroflexi bacterium]
MAKRDSYSRVAPSDRQVDYTTLSQPRRCYQTGDRRHLAIRFAAFCVHPQAAYIIGAAMKAMVMVPTYNEKNTIEEL